MEYNIILGGGNTIESKDTYLGVVNTCLDVINVIVLNTTQEPKQSKSKVFIISNIILSETEMQVLSNSYNYI